MSSLVSKLLQTIFYRLFGRKSETKTPEISLLMKLVFINDAYVNELQSHKFVHQMETMKIP